MNVIHFPVSPINPYFVLLVKYLHESGIRIDGSSGYLSLRKVLRGQRYDVIHIHFIPETIGQFLDLLLRCWVYRLLGSRIIKTCHNIRSHSNAASRQAFWCEKLFVSFADSLIFFTERQRQEFCEYYRVCPKSSSIISHPYLHVYPSEMTRETARSSFGFGDDDFVYLIFGGVRKFKNYDRVIEVFQQIRTPQDRLLMAIHRHPDNPVEQDAFDRCQRLLDRDQHGVIAHIGFLEDHELQRYFRAADVLLVPFVDNTSSTTFMLSLEFDKPFISLANNFNQSVLNDQCGIYIHHLDELREAMLKIKTANLDTMRQAIIARKPLFSWNHVIQQHLDLYRRVVGTKNG